ncbi:MAG: hypothetical protein HRT66_13705 [Flavobacteriaceae bacterium]|nr:hypothetical protein [Flavobacteriaceae bacterium]
MLKNYIAFQRLRYSNSVNISFTEKTSNNSFKIPSMILLSLLENSFKHGLQGDKRQEF